jgi:ribosomal-protein-alanine N-acetyltransferase
VILNLTFSNFNADQIKDILSIEKQSQYSSWTEKMFFAETENKFSFFKIIKNNNNVIGYIIYRIVFDEAEILNIVIDKDFRGLKIGKALINFAIEDIKKKNCKVIFLEVHKNNIIAQKLYERMGFKKYGTRQKYYSGFDAILMKLELCNF